MTIKSILIPFSGTQDEMSALSTAYSLAKTDGAHIRALFIIPDTDSIIYSADEKNWMETTHTEQSKLALKRFTKFSSAYHIPTCPADNIPANGVSASFTVIKGNFKDTVSYHGKLSDIIVVDRAIQEFGDTVQDPIISAVRETGKGMLLLPPNKSFTLGDSVMIAWNGSAQAARAVSNALPILRHASKVVIVTDGAIKKHIPDPMALASYLKIHNITTKTLCIDNGSEGDDTTAALLTEEAQKHHCKLIVMGAFTHSPLQQMVLGGVTRTMLESNNIPVFMAN